MQIEYHGACSRRTFLVGSGLAAAGCLLALPRSLAGDSVPLPHEALYYDKLDGNMVRCTLCPRQCQVPDGARGYCRVRENRKGTYYSLVFNHPCAVNVDPIEKKPLFHVYPGSTAFSLATAGCNIACKFCQNWDISQARPEDVSARTMTAAEVAAAAAGRKCRTIAFTYNEPTIFYEYMSACAKAGNERGIGSVVISNGFINAAPQKALLPLLKAIKIDFKAFTEKFYRDICGGMLEPVLASLKRIKAAGTWLEIVNLIIPTLNDSGEEIKRMAGWIVKELGRDVPLHFSRYHPEYKIRNIPPTPPETMLRARQLAMAEGCRFVYIGNVQTEDGQDTICPHCGKKIIRRYGYTILENRMTGTVCGYCRGAIPGVWI